jgi:hypothetical protein
MKAMTSCGMGAFLAVIALVNPAMGQPPQPPGIIEIVACNFLEGRDAGDLAGPMNAFNEWADDHDIEDFTVTTLMPAFTSDALTYDVLFMNRWRDTSAFGREMGVFYGPGGDEAVAGFAAVVDCSATTAFASFLVAPPGDARDGGPLQFQNCTVKENRTLGDAIGAINQLAEATAGTYGTGHVVLIPVVGENPDATYTFKWMLLHESWQNYGDNLGALFAGGGPPLGDFIDPVMDCDLAGGGARIYNQTINRRMQADD